MGSQASVTTTKSSCSEFQQVDKVVSGRALKTIEGAIMDGKAAAMR